MSTGFSGRGEFDGPTLGPWMATASGGRIYPLHPEASTFTIQDIAMGLANTCRFSGQIRFYSVAEHSVLLANHCFWQLKNQELARYALMHDAAEAFYTDLPKPLKILIPRYSDLEGRLMGEIFMRVGLHPVVPDDLWALDSAITGDEARFFFSTDWTKEPDCMVKGTLNLKAFVCNHPKNSMSNFLRAYEQLFPNGPEIRSLLGDRGPSTAGDDQPDGNEKLHPTVRDIHGNK